MIKDNRIKKRLPFISTVFRGIGQIMLVENAWTGLLFCIGVFYGSYLMGVGCLLAAITGTITAYALKYNKSEIEQGLYGFSAALVGVAIMLFFKPAIWAWIAIVLGSIASAMLQHFFIVKKIAVFTFPFVIVTWILMFILKNIMDIEPSILLDIEYSGYSMLLVPFHGFGQVIFQGTLFAGIVFVLAVIIGNPLAALFGVIGAIVAALIAGRISAPIESIDIGLWSYNAVLASIVFAGKKISNVLWMIIATVLTVLIYYGMFLKGYTALTFPFVAATILTLYLKKWVSRYTF